MYENVGKDFSVYGFALCQYYEDFVIPIDQLKAPNFLSRRLEAPVQRGVRVHMNVGLRLHPCDDDCFLLAWRQPSGCHYRPSNFPQTRSRSREWRFNPLILNFWNRQAAVDILCRNEYHRRVWIFAFQRLSK